MSYMNMYYAVILTRYNFIQKIRWSTLELNKKERIHFIVKSTKKKKWTKEWNLFVKEEMSINTSTTIDADG